MSSSQSSRNPPCRLNAPPGVENWISLPERLMTQARRTPCPYKAARLAQSALGVGLLLLMQMRISTLAALHRERPAVPAAKGKRV